MKQFAILTYILRLFYLHKKNEFSSLRKLSQKALHNSTELVAFAKSYLGCIQDRYSTLITSKSDLLPSLYKST